MSQGFESGNSPGFTENTFSREEQVWYAGPDNQHQRSHDGITLDSTNTDAGNSPTSTGRGGMILAKETASGNHYYLDPDANDGRQFATGVMEKTQSILQNGTATNRFMTQLGTGLLKSQEIIEDGGTKGAFSLQSRAQLVRQGFHFDGSGPEGAAGLSHPIGVERVAATTKTLVATDNGKLFLQITGAGNFTLPANSAANVGFTVEVLQTTDNNLVITSAAGNDIIALHDVAASTLTFDTGSNKIGARVKLELRYIAASTRRWLVVQQSTATMTVA